MVLGKDLRDAARQARTTLMSNVIQKCPDVLMMSAKQ